MSDGCDVLCDAMILAIDPSLTSTGYAYRHDGHIYTGLLRTEKMRTAERLDYILRTVDHIRRQQEPNLIVYEGYAMGIKGGGRAFDIGELGGLLKHHFWRNGVDVLLVPPSSMKMFVTGKGNAKKPDVAAVIAEELGYSFGSEDESDAVGLLMVGEAFADSSYLCNGTEAYRRKALAGCQMLPARIVGVRRSRACVG